MKETVKSCSNCRYSYDLPSNRGPMAKTQYTGAPDSFAVPDGFTPDFGGESGEMPF